MILLYATCLHGSRRSPSAEQRDCTTPQHRLEALGANEGVERTVIPAPLGARGHESVEDDIVDCGARSLWSIASHCVPTSAAENGSGSA